MAKTLAGSQAGDLGGGLTLDNINNEVWQNLTQAGFQPEYVAIRRQTDLKPPRTADITAEDKKLVMLAAVGIGQNRLIDNIAFELPA